MGNNLSNSSSEPPSEPDYASLLFNSLDVENEGSLSLKDLMAASSLDVFMPHSLPALYFVDNEKDGRMNREEFGELLRLCVIEKEKAKNDVCHDRIFREVITRASAAGVKDCSVPCRTSFRRFYSYSNVLSVYDKDSAGDSDLNDRADFDGFESREHAPEATCETAVPLSIVTECSRSINGVPDSQPASCWPSSGVLTTERVGASRCSADVYDSPDCGIDECEKVAREEFATSKDLPNASEESNSMEGTLSCASPVSRDIDSCFRYDKMPDEYAGGSSGSESGTTSESDTRSQRDGSNRVEPGGETAFASGGGLECQGDSAYRNSCGNEDIESESGSDTDSDGDSDSASDSKWSNTEDAPDSKDSDPRALSSSMRLEPLDADCSTAIDAAVVESVSRSHIHKLVDALLCEGAREEFMKWLWNLVDYKSAGIVTLEELRVFLDALREDGIDLEELAFYKESGVPLDECIINEFDTTHSGGLEQDEFMVFADLVTREYEYWESRHLDCVGDFELGRTIGRGSVGVVRLGVHVDTHEKFAVKIVRKGRCADMSSIDREIEALKTGAHAHIVDLKQVLESEENMFLILGLCGGGSLANVVRLYPEHRMPERTARFYVRQILEALAFCHGLGICHRDVRLDNILLDNSGMVKVTDFGHSKMFSAGWDLHSSTLVGSLYTLSPEQVAGQLYSGEKIDVWSTGVAIYCLLVGRPPFNDVDSVKLLENISTGSFVTPDFLSDEASDLVRCMIRASPEERLPLSQLLQHPWFYVDNDEVPQMDVYKIAVDPFFVRRPDLAELIMAGTIHEHNLHFHLADKLNPTSSPEDLRGQDWSLKCMCLQMDIKFSVSLFSKPPCEASNLKDGSLGRMPNVASFSVLEDACASEASNPVWSHGDLHSMFDDDVALEMAMGPEDSAKAGGVSQGGMRPEVKRSASLHRIPRVDWPACDTSLGYDEYGAVDGNIDTFPHRRVLPRKAVPEATRLFDSDSRIAAAAASAVLSGEKTAAKQLYLHRSVTTEGVSVSGEIRRRTLVEGESITSLAQNASNPSVSPSVTGPSRRSSSRDPNEFVPFIEVRLQCGESGLFLRICHKLKTICETKLAAAAESQRKRSQGRKTAAASIVAFRQTVGS